jgi:hypothetical protein
MADIVAPPPCVLCGKPLKSAIAGPDGNLPLDATIFISHGNYGSTVFDPMDGSALIVNICDGCLSTAQVQGRVLFSPRPPLPPPLALTIWDGHAPESAPPLPPPGDIPELVEPPNATSEMLARQLHAPWDDDQVASLNGFQSAGWVHPFTCTKGSHTLVATPKGWICPHDTYTQDWAHDFMADWSWREMAPIW